MVNAKFLAAAALGLVIAGLIVSIIPHAEADISRHADIPMPARIEHVYVPVWDASGRHGGDMRCYIVTDPMQVRTGWWCVMNNFGTPCTTVVTSTEGMQVVCK